MITITVKGPRAEAIKEASRIKAMHQVAGKVVVQFDDADKMPVDYVPSPQIGVVIIVKPE